MQSVLTRLASHGVYVGTSSWKYPGWCGLIYGNNRYEYRGKFAKARFEAGCLGEYAEVFKTVSVDATYYAFPSQEFLSGLVSQVPHDFKFGFKVTGDITQKKFPKHPRFGKRAGKENEYFLSVDAFERRFLNLLEPFRSNVGILMFEFSRFYPGDFAHGNEFVDVLDGFLTKLPKGWPIGIELRNQAWLGSEYLHCLARHGITHIFNHWTDMPPVGEQLLIPGCYTTPELVAARFLVTPGLKYEESVERYEPFDRLQAIDLEARAAGSRFILDGLGTPQRTTFIFVNNRVEGNAPLTIWEMAKSANF